MEVHTTERTRHFLVKKPKKILQLRLEDKNVFNAIHLNSIGYVFEFGKDDCHVIFSQHLLSLSCKQKYNLHYFQISISLNRYERDVNLHFLP